MTSTLSIQCPIGVEYAIGERVFAATTPRGVVADALHDVGRTWEAELLRSDVSVVLADPVRPPHAGDVAAEMTRLLPWMLAAGASFAGMSAIDYEMLVWIDATGDPLTSPAWLFRWRATDTAAVFAAVRELPATPTTYIPAILAALAAAGVEVQQTPLF